MKNYEEFAKDDPEQFWKLHTAYTKAGVDVPEGTRVIATDWAVQNGVEVQGTMGVKVRDRNSHTIEVRCDGEQVPHTYWAGFWKRYEKPLPTK